MANTCSRSGMVIVGGGECGATAAMTLRERGWAGNIMVIGRESLQAYERPPLSKATLTTSERTPAHPCTKDQFDHVAICFRTSTEVARLESDRRRILITKGPSGRQEHHTPE